MNGKDILLGLKYVGDDLIEKAEYGQFPTRAEKTEKKGNSRRSIRRPLLIAAIIAVMLLLVGCAVVYVLKMQDVKIGEATETRDYRLVDGTYVEDSHEVNQNVLTLAGLKGTKAYQACADFFAFKEEYTQNMEAMMNNGTLPEDFFENDTYGKAMNAKASELAAQYGLKLEGEALGFRTTRNLCDALGIERLMQNSQEVSAVIDMGSCYENGNFYLDGKDKAILQKCVYENPYIPFNPFPKQAEMILATEKEVLIGGAAGGSKSTSLLMRALFYVQDDANEYPALILRRTLSDLKKERSIDSQGQPMA